MDGGRGRMRRRTRGALGCRGTRESRQVAVVVVVVVVDDGRWTGRWMVDGGWRMVVVDEAFSL